MVEVFEESLRESERKSSKGNQLKWEHNGIWYKADYAGYEGLAEYVVSQLLEQSDLEKTGYVHYSTEEMRYKRKIYQGCRSKDFTGGEYQLITLERLYKNVRNKSLNNAVYSIEEPEERLKFLVGQITEITGLDNFGQYLSKILTIDAFFLNEDRHTHNIAVMMNENGKFNYCPVFDNGAALLSDTTMDYPMDVQVNELIPEVKSKTFCRDFDEQLDVAEKLYGKNLKFCFNKKDVETVLADDHIYSEETKSRIYDIIISQMRKYEYLFK